MNFRGCCPQRAASFLHPQGIVFIAEMGVQVIFFFSVIDFSYFIVYNIEKEMGIMSVGHSAFCKKLSENDKCVIYAYSSFNYNDKRYLNDERICDGRIVILKKSFSDGLGILRDSLSQLFENGDIIIENCSNTWMKHSKGYDVMAVHLLCKLLRQAQELQCFPDKCNYEV